MATVIIYVDLRRRLRPYVHFTEIAERTHMLSSCRTSVVPLTRWHSATTSLVYA